MESDKRDGGTLKLLFEDLDKEILRLIWFEVKDIPDNRLREYEFVRRVKGMLSALGVEQRICSDLNSVKSSNVTVEFVENVEVELPSKQVIGGDVIVYDNECVFRKLALIDLRLDNFYLPLLGIHIATNKRRVDKRSLLLMRCSVRYKL